MKYFGQELFDISETETSGDLTDPVHLDARAHSLESARTNGIDAALAADNLDAIIAPSYSFASTPAAVAGYPNISIPVGLTPGGKPAGIWMYSGFLREPRLLALSYDLEQELQPRRQSEMLGELPPEPPDAGICVSLPHPQIGGKAHLPHRIGPGKPFRF
jgi:amidase